MHQGFYDPSEYKGIESERLSKFRDERDEIKDWIERTFRNE